MDIPLRWKVKSLYKLIHKNQVVAPFADVVEMCGFIKMG